MIKMVVVLTVLSALFRAASCGGFEMATAAQIENQQLKFVKGPAIKDDPRRCVQ